MKNPIKSQKEADEVKEFLIRTTMQVKNIERDQAEKRINALFNSGILNNGRPDCFASKLMIDKFMDTQID